MNLLALPAFEDNYIWMIHNGCEAVVVDPVIQHRSFGTLDQSAV
ncbi:hypothetical protein BDD16_003294 [Sphaerotilus montanus]|uniref:Hydroxyacylglutathione hydrolase n=1 Tax=Sphaerotilus montanus TaxID=522889 RepID=A0A7Y9QZV9_9BURK|nr:hypothetical protein [Sphaerotilus montanus]